jgi:hypothetical protein
MLVRVLWRVVPSAPGGNVVFVQGSAPLHVPGCAAILREHAEKAHVGEGEIVDCGDPRLRPPLAARAVPRTLRPRRGRSHGARARGTQSRPRRARHDCLNAARRCGRERADLRGTRPLPERTLGPDPRSGARRATRPGHLTTPAVPVATARFLLEPLSDPPSALGLGAALWVARTPVRRARPCSPLTRRQARSLARVQPEPRRGLIRRADASRSSGG